MEYSEPVRRYFECPAGAGALQGRKGLCVAGSAGLESRGLRIWLAARIVDGRVAEARFRAYGCPNTIAVAAWTTEQITGQAAHELGIDPLAAAAELALPAEKLNCALCAEDALDELRSNWAALAQSKNREI